MKASRWAGLGVSLSLVTACSEVVSISEYEPAQVRVAHLSPDAPAVDFCIAPAGTEEFAGPILAGAGGLAGLSYGRVTRYFDVSARAYDVRFVTPGAEDCNTSLGGLPDFVNLPELPAGGSVTIAATGKLAHGGSAPFALVPYIDRLDSDDASAQLRFIHASPGTGTVDVGLGGGAAFTPVFADLAYGQISAHEDGYVRTAPLAGAEISARLSGSITDALAIKPVTLPAGAIATAFAIGELGNATTPLRVLLCSDNAPPHQVETECAVVGGAPERALVRLAHLSPDAPAVDVCVTTAGGAFDQPLLASLGARIGLAYPEVTEYVELPIASYDVRVIAATDTTCANAVVPDTRGLVVTAGLRATLAAIGDLERSGAAIADPGFRIATFVDDETLAAGTGKLRFIHASPGTPNVDVGLGAGHGFVRLFGNVEFGRVAQHGGIDALGYLEANPFTAAISARLANATTDALTIPTVALSAGQVVTVFAIGNKTGQAANPLRVLRCIDNARTGSLYAFCSIVF